MSWDSACLTRSTLFIYCPEYLVIMICNQRKLILHKAKWLGCQFQDRKLTKTYRLRKNLNRKLKIANCNFYSFPSDTAKHSIDSSKPVSSRLTLNILVVQLSKSFDESIIQLSHDCVKFLFDLKVSIVRLTLFLKSRKSPYLILRDTSS